MLCGECTFCPVIVWHLCNNLDMETGTKEQNGNGTANDEHVNDEQRSEIDSRNDDTQDSTAFNGTENGSETVDESSRMSFGEDSKDAMASLERKALSNYDENSQDSVEMDTQGDPEED